MEGAARDVEQSIQTSASDFQKDMESSLGEDFAPLGEPSGAQELSSVVPAYKHPGKNWRLKRGAMPQWYKARAGVRTKAQSGAARVARFRPQKFH